MAIWKIQGDAGNSNIFLQLHSQNTCNLFAMSEVPKFYVTCLFQVLC